MPIRRIYPTPRFKRSFRALPRTIQKRVAQREGLFGGNPFDPRLDTHQLKGRLKGLWSYSVDFRYRVLFRFIDGDAVIYYDIGDHSIYR